MLKYRTKTNLRTKKKYESYKTLDWALPTEVAVLVNNGVGISGAATN